MIVCIVCLSLYWRSIIFKNYHELTTEEQAEKWCAIMPKEGQWQNTIKWDKLTRTVTLPGQDKPEAARPIRAPKKPSSA
jgi:hypothetical protein